MAASKHFLTFTEQIESLKNEFVSLIQAGYPAHTVPPRMSSHCYKLFDLFSLDFSHKTVVLEQRTLYCCYKISREDVTSLLQVQ